MSTIKSTIESYSDIIGVYDVSKNTTRNVMTRFEKCKIIGMRLEQISRGMPTLVDETGLTTIEQVVDKELIERKIPYIIARSLPNDKIEYWKVSDLELSS
jgi:DNA-directed RNA polymerase subunit K/omega